MTLMPYVSNKCVLRMFVCKRGMAKDPFQMFWLSFCFWLVGLVCGLCVLLCALWALCLAFVLPVVSLFASLYGIGIGFGWASSLLR